MVFLTDPSESTVMANACSFAGPLLVLFVIFQRQAVAGMTTGAVK